MKWNEKVRAALEARGKTMADLARVLDRDHSQISKWMRGLHTPRPEVLSEIASYLGLSVNYLMDEKEPWPPRQDLDQGMKILSSLSIKYWPLVEAMQDPKKRDFLLDSLVALEKTY